MQLHPKSTQKILLNSKQSFPKTRRFISFFKSFSLKRLLPWFISVLYAVVDYLKNNFRFASKRNDTVPIEKKVISTNTPQRIISTHRFKKQALTDALQTRLMSKASVYFAHKTPDYMSCHNELTEGLSLLRFIHGLDFNTQPQAVMHSCGLYEPNTPCKSDHKDVERLSVNDWNQTFGSFYSKKQPFVCNVPSPYRVHETPNAKEIDRVSGTHVDILNPKTYARPTDCWSKSAAIWLRLYNDPKRQDGRVKRAAANRLTLHAHTLESLGLFNDQEKNSIADWSKSHPLPDSIAELLPQNFF